MSPLLIVLLCFILGCAFWFSLSLCIAAKDRAPTPEDDDPWTL